MLEYHISKNVHETSLNNTASDVCVGKKLFS